MAEQEIVAELMDRPPKVTLAVRLLYATVVVGVIGGILRSVLSPFFSVLKSPSLLAMAGVFGALAIALALLVIYKIGQGRNWVRIILLVAASIQGLRWVLAVPAFVILKESAPFDVQALLTTPFALVGFFQELITLAMQVTAVVLLYHGSSSEWFRRKKEGMRAEA